jgi:hypothetical protein
MGKLREFLALAFGFVRQTKDSYEAGTRFNRLRIWIVGVLALDVIATIAFVMFAGSRPLDVDVWFEPAFPSNYLVVRNQEGVLSNATLVLDNLYTLTVERIEPGLNGYEVNRTFRDRQDASPPDSYKPKQLEIRFGKASYELEVGDKQAAP